MISEKSKNESFGQSFIFDETHVEPVARRILEKMTVKGVEQLLKLLTELVEKEKKNSGECFGFPWSKSCVMFFLFRVIGEHQELAEPSATSSNNNAVMPRANDDGMKLIYLNLLRFFFLKCFNCADQASNADDSMASENRRDDDVDDAHANDVTENVDADMPLTQLPPPRSPSPSMISFGSISPLLNDSFQSNSYTPDAPAAEAEGNCYCFLID